MDRHIRFEQDRQIDMLKGNVNRICVSRDKEELKHQYEVAKNRLDDLYFINLKRVENGSE